jgi:alkanesulfonate monooxygenase SsuD/methylene tetrahydromethanopterin reductase-like flavin-dependent oxidoreductase (luciferase family)
MTFKLGVALNDDLLTPDPFRRRLILDHIDTAGLDHVTTGDHISFHGGTGFDGLVSATAILATHDRLDVLVGVYLAGLRHPTLTARQLATISQIAPGRLVLGVGAGGDDRREVANAGVDPANRGRRLDETLALLRELATGSPVTHKGRFFEVEEACVLPAPEPRVPLVVGGSGDRAIERTARFGDGWLGIFCSARRFADTVDRVRTATSELGRPDPSWFGVSVWCGLSDHGPRARALLGARMEALYRLPAERFQHVTAAGNPEQVAATLAPFLAGGAEHVTLVTVAEDPLEGVELAGEVRRLLQKEG